MSSYTAVPTPPSSPAVTVRSILHLDEIRGARPQVLSGADRLDRPVRWVHIAETEEVPSLLEGGELILSSGTMFRQSPARTRDFLTRLDGRGRPGSSSRSSMRRDSRPPSIGRSSRRPWRGWTSP